MKRFQKITLNIIQPSHISLMLAQNQFVMHISIVTNSVATLWKEPDVGNLMIDWDLY